MDPTLDIDYGSSHDQLLHVHTFSIGGDHWDRSKSQIYRLSSGDLFTLGSLYATAICIDQKVNIAILQCTSLKSALQYLDCAPLKEISLPESNYDVSGQILSLYPILQSSPNSEALSWVWNTKFVSLDAAAKSHLTQQAGTTTTRICHLSFPVNGCLVLPLHSHQFNSIPVSNLPPDATKEVTAEKTWIITEKDLQEIKLSLLQQLQEDENTCSKIPVYGKVHDGAFPYTSTNHSSLYFFSSLAIILVDH
jgi:hypothetical protein